MACMSAVEKFTFLPASALSSLEESRTSFNTVSLPSFRSHAQSQKAVVVMAAFDRKELLTKPLVLLKQLARKQGIVANTRDQLINALSGNAPAKTYQAPSYTPSYSAPAGADEDALNAKSLGELRALAKDQGLRGDTKAELVKLLLAAGGSSAAAPAAAFFTATQAAPGAGEDRQQYERRLQVKPMSKLRAIARQRGINAPSRPAIIAALLALHSGASKPGATAAAVQAAKDDAPEILEQLESLPLSELRALAKARGLRGDTRSELVKLLTASGSKPAAPAAVSYSAPAYSAPASSNGSFYPTSNGNGSAAAKPSALSARELNMRSIGQLRAMAAQRGIRANTKQELVAALAA